MKIGILLPLIEEESTGRPVPWPQLRSYAQQAEVGGLDSVWIYDHLMFHYEGKEPQSVHEAMMVWAGLAEATEHVELGALVLCTAFRNPAVLAKMAVTLDEISNGRVILGIGAGWHKPEFDAFGLDFDHLVDQFEEAIQIIKPLVQEGSVDFVGHYSQAPDCHMLPAPQRPIPVLVASFKPRMLRLTARYADQWNTAWLGEASALEPALLAMNLACEQEGRDPATLAVTVGVNVRFEDSEEVDRKKVLAGDAAFVAGQFDAYARAGVDHLIARLDKGVSEVSIAALLDAISLMQHRHNQPE